MIHNYSISVNIKDPILDFKLGVHESIIDEVSKWFPNLTFTYWVYLGGHVNYCTRPGVHFISDSRADANPMSVEIFVRGYFIGGQAEFQFKSLDLNHLFLTTEPTVEFNEPYGTITGSVRELERTRISPELTRNPRLAYS